MDDKTFNEMSAMHGRMFELAREYSALARRLLDSARICNGAADQIEAGEQRLTALDLRLYGPGRPVMPHRTGQSMGYPSPRENSSEGK